MGELRMIEVTSDNYGLFSIVPRYTMVESLSVTYESQVTLD